MSFSRSFKGAPLVILAALAALPAEQKKVDESWTAPNPGVVAGHQAQIALAIAELTPVLNNAPTDVVHQVDVWGHAGDDGSGNVGWLIRRSDAQTPAIPTPT